MRKWQASSDVTISVTLKMSLHEKSWDWCVYFCDLIAHLIHPSSTVVLVSTECNSIMVSIDLQIYYSNISLKSFSKKDGLSCSNFIAGSC